MTRRLGHIALTTGALVACIVLCACRQNTRTGANVKPVRLAAHRPVVDYAIAFDDLVELLPKVVEDLHWATLRTRQTDNVLRLDALTPADLSVDLRAKRLDDDHTAVQIKVGLVRHADLEQQFHKILQKSIKEQTES